MEEGHNDDNDSTFGTLSAVTERVLSKIEQRQTNDSKGREERGSERQQTERAKGEQREYVDRRLRELAAFERRSAGKGFKR